MQLPRLSQTCCPLLGASAILIGIVPVPHHLPCDIRKLLDKVVLCPEDVSHLREEAIECLVRGEGVADGIRSLWLMCPKRGRWILGFVGVCGGDEFIELVEVFLCAL